MSDSILSDAPEMHEPWDTAATRQAIFDRVLTATSELQPVVNDRYQLRLADVHYDPRFKPPTIADQKQAVLSGRGLGRNMYGTLQLSDAKSGRAVDSSRTLLGTVPYLTERGTFVHNGTEFGLANQLRLLPGVFTRRKSNEELETHVNVAKGLGHRIQLDPATGIYKLNIAQSSLPLLPILKAMGVNDSAIKEAWGDELFYQNSAKSAGPAVRKLYEKLYRGAPPDGTNLEQSITDAFEKMTLDPEVTKRTLGQPFDRVNRDALMAITRKLRAVNTGAEDPDDRDAMAYQRLVGPEDLFAESVSQAGGRLRQLLWKSTPRGNLTAAQSRMLDDSIQGTILRTGLGAPLEMVNMAELLDAQSRVTRMGRGGLPSIDSIPEESRNLQPTQFGFVDALRTPESSKVGVDLRLGSRVRKGKDGRLYSEFVDASTGKNVFKSPQDVADSVLGFPEALRGDAPFVPALVKGQMQMVPRKSVQYVVPSMEHAFSPLGNLVPLKSTVKGQRAVMGSRMLSQALPLEKPEAPFVQSGVTGSDKSYEEEYGKYFGAVRADAPAEVENVTKDAVTLRLADGTRKNVDLYNNFAFNRQTLLNQTPRVKPGDMVQPGDLLASSTYTDDNGSMALGKNLRVGYIPDRGWNFEDAISISESAAKKLASVRAYQHSADIEPGMVRGKKEYISSFPKSFDRNTLEKMDDDGVVKPGEIVKEGDPLILQLQARDSSKARIHTGRKSSYTDQSSIWEHSTPGEVLDVVKTDKGVNVVVRTIEPMKVGDKIAGRVGDKGVVARILPDDQMPMAGDGEPLEVMLNPLGVISRTNPMQVIEAALGKIAAKTGKPYKLQDFGDTEDWAEFARQELRKHNLTDKEDLDDPVTGRKIPAVLVGNRWMMKLSHTSEQKQKARAGGSYTAEGIPSRGGYEGCFAATQKIQTIQGPMDIATICEKRLGVQVRTFSESLGEWVYRPVVDWFTYRTAADSLLTIETNGGPCDKESRTNRTRACLYVTRNHNVMTPDGMRSAGELRIGDSLVTWGLEPSNDQWAYMLGTLLGDTSVIEHKVVCEHSVKQTNYTNWKREVLAGLLPQTCDTKHTGGENALPSVKGKTHFGRAVWVQEDHVVHKLKAMCYSGDNGQKTVTDEWLAQLTDLSVAAWFLDDGSITNRAKKRGRINISSSIATQGFTKSECEKLANWLTVRYGAACTAGSGGQLCVSADLARKLIEIVAANVPYVAIPKSKRFLVKQVRAIQMAVPVKPVNNVARLAKVPLRITDIRPYRHPKRGVVDISVYDFTVADTHTYVAGHALVSNSKKVGMMELHALLSHGATGVIADNKLYRGQANPELWSRYMSGYDLPAPKVPLVYQKFVSQLKASGINVVRDGPRTNIMTLRDKDIDDLAGDREITNANTVDWNKDLREIPGGLFDTKLTGGISGNRWSYIRLPEPMVNPIMEEPTRRILGLTKEKFRDVMSGKETLHGHKGPEAIAKALDGINVDKELEYARAAISGTRKTARDAAIRKFGYLKSAQKLGIHPREWVLSKVPVLPPMFRPVSTIGPNKLPLVDDANYLYQSLMEAGQNLREAREQLEDVGEERLAVYDAFNAVTGLGDPIHPQHREKKVRGVLQKIFGSSPKFGVTQQKLLGQNVDLVGRSVISPDPNLDMDEVGIPESQAWQVYKPMIVRNLVKQGMPRMTAMNQVESQSPRAKDVMLAEMARRPVIITRAPTLHRYGKMAAWPRLTKGSTLRISPLVVGGFGADFDGDQMNFHVPLSDRAVRDAVTKMLPSANLFSTSKFSVFQLPTMEYVGGLYEASSRTDMKAPPVTFATRQEALRAYQRGEIGVDRRVNIIEK